MQGLKMPCLFAHDLDFGEEDIYPMEAGPAGYPEIECLIVWFVGSVG
jgi:hypothetical protein